jgi:hypothetical protein
MSNQLFHNDQGLRNYINSRYQDLSREAEQERLARLAEGDRSSRPTAALATVSVALTLLLVAAWIVL